MKMFKKKLVSAFTLIELLVVIAIIALLAALLVPAVNKAMLNGRVTMQINNGKQIYTALFASETDDPLGLAGSSRVNWPKKTDAQYVDSCDFMAALVESNVLDVTYAFFGGPGTGVKVAKDKQEFIVDTEFRNIWCIVQDVSDSMKSGAPVLFTQNFNMTAQTIDKLDQQKGLSDDANPFGTKAAVVVQRGGAAAKLALDTAIPTNFNGTVHNNGFLWPNGTAQYKNP